MEEVKKYRSAKIDVVANGFIIEIGCQRLVASSASQLKNMVCDYIDDPIGYEEEILENSIRFIDSIPVNSVPTAQSNLRENSVLNRESAQGREPI